ncbi:hypothetical protein [Faecalibacter bovis]|uniref:Leucine-rich repeat domain-containing protein n=1 Tax=Faecalibacter bovis TaxID=2898187 RepID=A0ABX7XEZ2_9FLAO|nr:hypothetical protein [Faecalibacter bovis]QTV06493.1 hypothetical protein J9309_03995 [Faecalibacter bovis]
MVNLYQKAIAIAALFIFQGVHAQVWISDKTDFQPRSGYALQIDGNLKVDSGIKLAETDGEPGQVLKSTGPNSRPVWVDNPDVELPEGMLFIENTYTKIQENGAENVLNNRISTIPSITPGELYTSTNTNNWKKIIEINNIVVSEKKTFINVDFQTGVTLTKSSIRSGDFTQFACGVFLKKQNETSYKLKGYRLGQVTAIGNVSIVQSNFDMIYTINLDPETAIGTYDSFIGCKKFNEFPLITGNSSNFQLYIGSSSDEEKISKFNNQSVYKVDVSFKL